MDGLGADGTFARAFTINGEFYFTAGAVGRYLRQKLGCTGSGLLGQLR